MNDVYYQHRSTSHKSEYAAASLPVEQCKQIHRDSRESKRIAIEMDENCRDALEQVNSKEIARSMNIAIPSTPRVESESELRIRFDSLNSSESSASSRKTVRKHWTSEEDQLLTQAVTMLGEGQWKRIAEHVGTRNHTQCLQRWKKALCPGLKKGQWSKEEDEQLIFQVSKGYRNWGQLANHMPGRTSKQCRERWIHHLDPEIKKTEYSPDEDALIVELQRQLGNRWSEISRHLRGRTENAVKIRWKAITRGSKGASPMSRSAELHQAIIVERASSLKTEEKVDDSCKLYEKPKLIEVATERANMMLNSNLSNIVPMCNEAEEIRQRQLHKRSCKTKSLSPMKVSRPDVVPPLTPQIRSLQIHEQHDVEKTEFVPIPIKYELMLSNSFLNQHPPPRYPCDRMKSEFEKANFSISNHLGASHLMTDLEKRNGFESTQYPSQSFNPCLTSPLFEARVHNIRNAAPANYKVTQFFPPCDGNISLRNNYTCSFDEATYTDGNLSLPIDASGFDDVSINDSVDSESLMQALLDIGDDSVLYDC